MKLRAAIVAFAVLAMLPLVAQALLQQQRAQIGITIIINATPNPLGYVRAPGASDTIVATATLRGAPPAIERAFEAQQLHFMPTSSGTLVAQAHEKSVRVEAEVTPNPNATLLTTDAPGSTVVLSAEAGIATHFACVYHVKVDTTLTGWTLKHGLSADFAGTATSWPGGDVANNSYLATPNPTSTPFLFYSTDGGVWAVLQVNSGIQTYCVDLTIDMPIATPQGTYSSNAIYTLYY